MVNNNNITFPDKLDSDIEPKCAGQTSNLKIDHTCTCIFKYEFNAVKHNMKVTYVQHITFIPYSCQKTAVFDHI